MVTCEMTDGNGVAAMSRKILTRSYMSVRPRSRATGCASPFCAHFNHVDNRRLSTRATLSHATPAKETQE